MLNLFYINSVICKFYFTLLIFVLCTVFNHLHPLQSSHLNKPNHLHQIQGLKIQSKHLVLSFCDIQKSKPLCMDVENNNF